MDHSLYQLAERVGQALKRQGSMLVTAESCTGGWVSEAITMVPGSSDWFERGFVTYTYISKREMLGVSPDTLGQHGAVSEPVAAAMAAGAVANSAADCALSVTGVAGPGGGTAAKPVGMVCFGWIARGVEPRTATLHLPGDRAAVRDASVETALSGLLELIGEVPL